MSAHNSSVAVMRAIDPGVVNRRRLAYATTLAGLLFGYLALKDSVWRSDIELHTVMETAMTVLALAVGSLALVRFYSRKDNTFLFIGTGFIVTGLMDGYHALITSSHFIETFPSTSPALIAWSWFSARSFLALLLWLSWLFWRREARLGDAGRIDEYRIYASVGVLAMVCIAIVALVPMPPAYHPQLAFPRPQEFVPALFFLLALIGYLSKGEWKTDPFEHWLVLSLIVGFMGQALFMSRSHGLHDTMFDAAHLLKGASYLCAMAGLLFNMAGLFSESRAQQELARQNALLHAQLEVSPDAILVVDEHGKIISYNRHFVELWRLPPDLVAAGDDAPVLRAVVAQTRDPATFLARVKQLNERRTEQSSEEIVLADGRIIERFTAPIASTDGRYYGRILFFHDITERKNAEQTIRDEKHFSDKLIAGMPDMLAVLDSSGRFVRWNSKAQALLGLSDAEMPRANAFSFVYEDDLPLMRQSFQEALERGDTNVVARVTARRGMRDYAFNGIRIDSSRGVHVIVVGADITERKHAEAELHELQARLHDQSTRDPLTGLYNRHYLEEALRRELIRAQREGDTVGLIMGDLDHFKVVNDRYGHLAGDEALRFAGRLMERHAKGRDICCRYGPEEFLLVLPGVTMEGAIERAEALRGALAAAPIPYGPSSIAVTASFGVTAFPRDGQSVGALIAAAQAALLAAKAAGRNRVQASLAANGTAREN